MKCGWGLSVWLLSQLMCLYRVKGKKGEDSLKHTAPRGFVPWCPGGCRVATGSREVVATAVPSAGHQALPGEVENCREAPSLLAAGPHTLHTPAESRCPNSVFRQTQFIYSRCWVLPPAPLCAQSPRPAGTAQEQPQGQQEPSHPSPALGLRQVLPLPLAAAALGAVLEGGWEDELPAQIWNLQQPVRGTPSPALQQLKTASKVPLPPGRRHVASTRMVQSA